MLARSGPLLRELERALPARPFAIECWDGGQLVSTTGEGPIFSVRSPGAVAHALRAPGQLGIGRAYVAGALEPDDLDAALALLSTWKPPSLARATRAWRGPTAGWRVSVACCKTPLCERSSGIVANTDGR